MPVWGKVNTDMQAEGLSDNSFKSSTWPTNRFHCGSYYLCLLTLREEKITCNYFLRIIAANINYNT